MTENSKRKLRKHQQDGIDFIGGTGDNRAILDHGMSLGKTLSAIRWWAETELPILIVAPLISVQYVWQQELQEEGIDFSVIPSTKPAEVREALKRAPVTLVNYAKVRTDKVLKTILSDGSKRLLVLDECHRTKDSNSKTTRALYEIQKRMDGVVGLTGTLLPNSFMDIHGQMKIVDPFLFDYRDDTGTIKRGIYKTNFINRFADFWIMPGTRAQIVKNVRKNKQGELGSLIARRVHSVRTHDVMDMPEEIHITRKVQLPERIQKYHDEMQEEYILELGDAYAAADNILVKIIRLKQITAGYIPMQENWEVSLERLHTYKAEAAYSVVEEAQYEPVVIFFNYTPESDILTDVIRKNDKSRNIYYLDGSRKQLDEWRKDDTGILLVQADSGSESIDLTHSALIVFYGYPKNLGKYEQAKARIARTNTTHERVRFYHIICEGTIDELVKEALDEKQDIIYTFKKQYLGG